MSRHAPTRAHNRRRLQGILLMEMVAALAILGIFITVCMQLYMTTMRLHREAMNAGVRTRLVATPLEALRNDLWNGLTFAVNDPANLAVQQWEDRTIAWTFIESDPTSGASEGPGAGGGGQLERSVLKGGRMIAQLRWPMPRGVTVRFESDGHLLGVTLSDDEFHRTQPLWLTSQLHTLEEARR